MFDEIIFDLETQRLFEDIDTFNPADLGLSVICLYRRTLNSQYQQISGQMYTFWPDQLSQLWPLFGNVSRVIGFNSLFFDNLVLQPLCTTFDFAKLNHFDLMAYVKAKLGHRLSLNSIASQTLSQSKIDSGKNAVDYWQKGDPASLALLEKYCQADVLLTRDIYDFGLKYGYLKYLDKWNQAKQVEVDFSYPVTATLF